MEVIIIFNANSHAQGLTGSGPWGAFEPRFYFTKYPDGLEGDPARGWGSYGNWYSCSSYL